MLKKKIMKSSQWSITSLRLTGLDLRLMEQCKRIESSSTTADDSVWQHWVWLINSEAVQRSESRARVCHNNNDPKKQGGIITSITPRLFLSNQGHPDVEFHLISLSSFTPAQLLAVTAGERFQNPGRSKGSGSRSFLRGHASGSQSATSISTGRWDREQWASQRWGRLTLAPAFWNKKKQSLTLDSKHPMFSRKKKNHVLTLLLFRFFELRKSNIIGRLRK